MVLQLCRLLRGFTHPGSYFRADLTSSEAATAAPGSAAPVGPDGGSNELTLFSVDQFSDEINALLDVTLCKGLLEKLTQALHDCLFSANDPDADELDDEMEAAVQHFDAGGAGFLDPDDQNSGGAVIGGGLVALGGGVLGTHRLLDQHEHFAVASVNGFLQNLYLYGTKGTAEYQQHLLSDTSLISYGSISESHHNGATRR